MVFITSLIFPQSFRNPNSYEEPLKNFTTIINSLQDFINNIEEAVEIDEKTRWKNQVGKIKEFIESPWGETKEREVILDKTNKEKFK